MTDEHDRGTPAERAAEFHEKNPAIFGLIEHFAAMALAADRKRYSINGLFERVRWHVLIDVRDDSGYKLNNDFRAFYARLWQERHPEHPGFFELRATPAERGFEAAP